MNNTGFFSLSKIKNLDELKLLYFDSLYSSYNAYVHELDSFGTRVLIEGYEPSKYINEILSFNTHNVVVDRSIQLKLVNYGEVASCEMNGTKDKFLFIKMELENLYYIVEKYGLYE